jgi:hypothetical protein
MVIVRIIIIILNTKGRNSDSRIRPLVKLIVGAGCL